MYDLHSHILPEMDDGAASLSVALEMAKALADQGVFAVACTPHILPGVYHNTGPGIRAAVEQLGERVREQGIALDLVPGADNHISADFVDGLRSGRLLTLADSAYVLVEPPHHVAPARLQDLFFELQVAGYVPILTHPERLTWIEEKYGLIEHLAKNGVWMQVTSGSLRGAFGRRALYWAERMLGDGFVHVLASDAHDMGRRRPDLADGFLAAQRLIGAEEAENLCLTRPRGILMNAPSTTLPTPPGWSSDAKSQNGEEPSGVHGSDLSRKLGRSLWRIFTR